MKCWNNWEDTKHPVKSIPDRSWLQLLIQQNPFLHNILTWRHFRIHVYHWGIGAVDHRWQFSHRYVMLWNEYTRLFKEFLTTRAQAIGQIARTKGDSAWIQHFCEKRPVWSIESRKTCIYQFGYKVNLGFSPLPTPYVRFMQIFWCWMRYQNR